MKIITTLSFYRYVLIICASLLIVASSFAAGGDPVVKLNKLDGSLDQLQEDSVVTVSDSSLIGTTFAAANKITLRINESSPYVLESSFSVTVGLHIVAHKASGTVNYDTVLRINYIDTGLYAKEHAFYFTGAYHVTATVTSATSDVGWDVWRSLEVLNEISSVVSHEFSCTLNRIDEVSGENVNDELNVSWPNEVEADEYDLEWTYIDASALSSGQYGDSTNPNPDLIFRNNASRVTVTTSTYKIPLLYDNAGHLFFRVRSAQLLSTGGRYEANWSNVSTGLGRFNYGGHERKLNWQATTTFAEEGKRKSVVQYYDGSLRSRQTVTKDNTADTTVVAETFYDLQGRPVIQVLPSPSLTNIIKYNQDFNRNNANGEYTTDNYDASTAGPDQCDQSAESMSTASGASQYYSPNNPNKDNSIHRFVPDAKGYPFSEVQYTPDNTGRIAKQSGVGPVHQLGKGHETVYYYGTPSQEELDALFGTEAGYNSHYQKTMVKDANGQFSVSYVDMRGRTVATALAGTPTAAALDTLSSYSQETITESLSDSSSIVIKDLVMESKRGLLVPKTAMHTFTYELSPQSLTLEGCSGSVCYDCLYDLRITISGSCNNSAFGGQAFDTLISNFTLGSIDGSCNGDGFSFSFSKLLEEGSYEVTKQLSVSKSAADYYRENIFKVQNTCQSIEDFINEQRTLISVDTSCVADCESCKTALGEWNDFRNLFLDQAGITTDTAAYTAQALKAYKEGLANCAALCDETTDYDNIRAAMLADMMAPSGQYANIDSADDVYSIYFSQVDVNPNDTAEYTRSDIIYMDEFGNPDSVYDESVEIFVKPQDLSPRSFSEKFKASWAEALLPLHPEWCKLQNYDTAAARWEKRFQAVETYSEAFALGYLNPTNRSSAPYNEINSSTSDEDPLADNPDYGEDLDERLSNISDLNGMTMWGVATSMVACPTGSDETCYQESNENPFASSLCEADLDMAWRAFREMYLNTRRELINQKIRDACPSPTYATDVELLGAYHQPHFSTGTTLFSNNGIDLPTGNDSGPYEAFEAAMKAGMTTSFDSTCRAYASMWLENLRNCAYDETDKTNIINQLVLVCKEGSDESHPFGSSSVKPSSTHTFRSFEEVIENYNTTNSIPINSNCNADLITLPRPYNNQTIYSEKPIWTTPDSCECKKITDLYIRYAVDSSGYSSFSDFLQQKYQTNIADSTLTTLLAMCNETSPTCVFLKKPVLLPAALQCYSGAACADCHQVDSLFTSFKTSYPSVIPTKGPINETEIANNKLFESYLNNRLGFTKTTAEYLNFLDSCNIPAPSVYSCDTLSYWLSQYNQYGGDTPHLDAGGCDTTHFKINYGTTTYDVQAKLSDVIQNGIARVPDSVVHPSRIWINFDYYDNVCVDSSGFTFETRLKIPDSTVIPSIFNSPLWIWLYNANNTGSGSLLTSFSNSAAMGLCTHASGSDPLRDCQSYTAPPHNFNDWRVVKIQLRNRNYKVFLDDNLMLEKTLDAPFTEFTSWSVVPLSMKGEIDYIKIYDTSGRYIYNENFNGCEQLATAKSNCVSECQDGFTNYFNSVSGRNYSSSQIRELYKKNCSTVLPVECPSDSLIIIRDNFDQYGGTPHFDAGGCDTTNWKLNYQGNLNYVIPVKLGDVFKDGIAYMPDSVVHPVGRNQIDFDFLENVCVDTSGFTLETRIKVPDSVVIPNGFNANVWMWINNHNLSFDPPGSIQVGFSHIGAGIGVCTHAAGADPLRSCVGYTTPVTSFNDWRIIKLQVRNREFKVYVDTILYATLALDAPFTGLGGWSIIPYSFKGMIDYVRVYDTAGNYIYNENFDGCSTLAHPRSLCAGACEEKFTEYFNSVRGTDYIYSQVDSVYQAAGIPLDICNNDTDSIGDNLLCGNVVPVTVPDSVISFITNCSDSAFFIYSNATELYKVYTDSLMGEFDANYRNKCLEAYKFETFTVSHQISEYHYTLYYYDQAGNLVKTIPPKGVNPNRGTSWLADVRANRAAKESLTPSHTMPTDYRYNTLNQVVAQHTPDAGTSEFWYDRLGRLVLSQNAKQKAVSGSAANRLYSYTKYDELGRINEVGQIKDHTGSVTVDDALTRNASTLATWFSDRNAQRGQITTTTYDLAYTGFTGFDLRHVVQQKNLRNRVSFVNFADTSNGSSFNQATYYSYDIHGNVDTLLQDYGFTAQYPNLMNTNGNRFKKVVYNYDLISGKVNRVAYQAGWSDQLFHKYSYDAENRLTRVETSFDGKNWETDARYEYYRHGPLARLMLGDQQVQGIDYAYTLQGWLKGVNSTRLFSSSDMGEDGLSGGPNQFTARDAFGFNLNYYDTSDYSAISGVDPFPGTMAGLGDDYRPLFNGNISSMAVNNRALGNENNFGGSLMLYNYRYDQLNRITRMDAYNGFNNSTNSWSGMTSLDQYRERVSYDGNGNILKYLRNGHKSSGNLRMDSLTYIYVNGKNHLLQVVDSVPDGRYGGAAGDVADIDDQDGNNYVYDEIGNLVRDVKEGLTSVKWSVYGKILEINRTANAANPISKIIYTYDAQGNRISKTVLKNTGNKTHTWYVRDAQGNVLAVYTSQGNPSDLATLSLNVSERHLYGSSRLGIYSGSENVDGGPKDMTDSNSTKYYRGLKQYELNNHLGNVLATISDKKIGVDEGSDGSIDYYDADVKTAQDYYPFGMMMPGRIGFKNGSSWSGETGEVAPDNGFAADLSIPLRENNEPAEYTATNSIEFVKDFESEDGDTFIAYISPDDGSGSGEPGSGSSLNGNYRYGFNGKEMDNEPKGTGNQYDYGFRIYDPRIGRFLSLDPLQKKYPELTPYQFSSNRPIDGFDLDGREYVTFGVEITAGALGKPSFRRFIIQDFRQLSAETMATIHGEPSYAEDFYERFSESFGPEGKGFKWIYYNDKGQQLGEPVWQMKQSGLIVENSGYYSGAGSITKYGPGLSTGHFAELGNDYDFGYEPMGYSDRISKKHDQIQQKEIKQPQGWLEDVRTLRSDKILLTDIDRGLIWEEANSKEDFSRLVNMRAFFTAVVAYKKWKVNEMNERRLDKNDPKNQLKIILSDWKPKTFSAQWYLKKVLEGSGGGAAEKNRNTVKPTQQTSP